MEGRFEDRVLGASDHGEGAERTEPETSPADYDGWFGTADSVLVALAEEAGFDDRRPDVSSYIALRVAPRDAPVVAAMLQRASARRLSVRRARTVRLTCIGSGEGPSWVDRFDFDSAVELAPAFVDAVVRSDGQLLAVVFAGPADLSEGWVAWAGVVRAS